MRHSARWLSFIAPLLLVSVASAQSTVFYVNKNPAGANSVIAYSLNYDGSFAAFQIISTGGNGSGGGYFAANRVVVGGPLSECLYASNDGSNTIAAFSVDPLNGSLTFEATFPSGGSSGGLGISLAATSDGSWLYAANAGSNNVVGFQIDPLGIGACNVAPLPFPPVPVLGAPDGVKTTADAAYLFVVSPGVGPHGSLYWFSINPSSGQLTPQPGSPMSVRSTGPFGGAAGVDISCAEDTVAVGEFGGGVIVDWFNFDPTTGLLTLGAGSPLTSASSANSNVVQFSADDQNLFVPGQNSANVSSFSTKPFTFQSATPIGAAGNPSNLATDANGLFAVTANFASVSSYVRRIRGDLDQEEATLIPGTLGAGSIAIKPAKCNN